jgi:hypothetical protein
MGALMVMNAATVDAGLIRRKYGTLKDDKIDEVIKALVDVLQKLPEIPQRLKLGSDLKKTFNCCEIIFPTGNCLRLSPRISTFIALKFWIVFEKVTATKNYQTII